MNLLKNERNLVGMFHKVFLTYPENLVKKFQSELVLLRFEVSIIKR